MPGITDLKNCLLYWCIVMYWNKIFTKSLPAIVYEHRHVKETQRKLLNMSMVWMIVPACCVSVSGACL